MGIISSNRFELLSEVAAVQYENPDSWGLFEKSPDVDAGAAN